MHKFDMIPGLCQAVYEATLLEAGQVGGQVTRVSATDLDEGENGRVTYRIENRAETHSDWFDIEPDTGKVSYLPIIALYYENLT